VCQCFKFSKLTPSTKNIFLNTAKIKLKSTSSMGSLYSYCQSINNNLFFVHRSIEVAEYPEFRAINNVIAFFHFGNILDNKEFNISDSVNQALSYIERFPRNSVNKYEFNQLNQTIVLKQINNLCNTYKDNIILNPFFPGCGIIDNCNGDILQHEKLIEIKAGKRNIEPSDLKQLIVYAALNWISSTEKYQISELEIYNPRVGYIWRNQLDDFLNSITDIPKEDVFDQLTKYLITQSEEIEV
jgi:hypothetical protein